MARDTRYDDDEDRRPMEDQMQSEMAGEGFSIEQGNYVDDSVEELDTDGEPYTDDFSEIFDDIGRDDQAV
ncbi:MAG: hypothetical protein IT324_20975 [Anaerolineae bacterium]|nr:hypothetical protein [Anaerolineae bacterium]